MKARDKLKLLIEEVLQSLLEQKRLTKYQDDMVVFRDTKDKLLYHGFRRRKVLYSMLLDDIHSNNKKRCARCDIAITETNASGWEVFVNENGTQPVCRACNEKLEAELSPYIRKGDELVPERN